jgi:nicotinamide riboside transporter PnuC
VASALVVFSSGYAAMMSNDWRKVTIVTLIGGVAGLVAAWFAQRAR